MELGLIIAVVVIALAFDYTNGFHDAANAIATSVSTRALTPRAALIMAAVMNMVGAFMGTEVAKTIGEGIIETPDGDAGLLIVMAALFGAVAWNITTWWFGLPTSSSHALIGGLVGGALAATGTGAVLWNGIVDKVVLPMIFSPLVGFLAAFLLSLAIQWIFKNRNPGPTNRGFRLAQTVSAAAMALGHGLQDAQKTMGAITLALVIGGYQATFDVQWWVIVLAASALALGTYAGGWRIMRTLGRRIVHLQPPQGFAAETVAASVLYTTAYAFHAPISTTHTITSAVMGVGASRRISAVRWGVARSIITAWVITIPMAALYAALFYVLLHLIPAFSSL